MYPTSLSFSLPVNPANPSHLAQSHFFRENGLTAFLSSIFVFLHQVASVKVFWLLTTWSRLYHFLKLALLLVHAFCISLSLSLSLSLGYKSLKGKHSVRLLRLLSCPWGLCIGLWSSFSGNICWMGRCGSTCTHFRFSLQSVRNGRLDVSSD